MAATNLLALIDDIATLLDDISVMGKVAAKKTAGVLGDDLSLNAEQVSGFNANRELPVVYAVAKGSLINKLILVPLALLISAFVGWLITPLMMVGGSYLCYEGAEKVWHSIKIKRQSSPKAAMTRQQQLAQMDPEQAKQYEKQKVRGAIRTDFILSAEIVVLTLGVVAQSSLLNQIVVLAMIAVGVTVGVYGLVAMIVKIDDLGLWLKACQSGIVNRLGLGLLWIAPRLMKFLSLAGTVAMFVVGGGIFLHSFQQLHHAVLQSLPAMPGVLHTLMIDLVLPMGLGAVIGSIVLGMISLVGKWRQSQE